LIFALKTISIKIFGVTKHIFSVVKEKLHKKLGCIYGVIQQLCGFDYLNTIQILFPPSTLLKPLHKEAQLILNKSIPKTHEIGHLTPKIKT